MKTGRKILFIFKESLITSRMGNSRLNVPFIPKFLDLEVKHHNFKRSQVVIDMLNLTFCMKFSCVPAKQIKIPFLTVRCQVCINISLANTRAHLVTQPKLLKLYLQCYNTWTSKETFQVYNVNYFRIYRFTLENRYLLNSLI